MNSQLKKKTVMSILFFFYKVMHDYVCIDIAPYTLLC